MDRDSELKLIGQLQAIEIVISRMAIASIRGDVLPADILFQDTLGQRRQRDNDPTIIPSDALTILSEYTDTLRRLHFSVTSALNSDSDHNDTSQGDYLCQKT